MSNFLTASWHLAQSPLFIFLGIIALIVSVSYLIYELARALGYLGPDYN